MFIQLINILSSPLSRQVISREVTLQSGWGCGLKPDLWVPVSVPPLPRVAWQATPSVCCGCTTEKSRCWQGTDPREALRIKWVGTHKTLEPCPACVSIRQMLSLFYILTNFTAHQGFLLALHHPPQSSQAKHKPLLRLHQEARPHRWLQHSDYVAAAPAPWPMPLTCLRLPHRLPRYSTCSSWKHRHSGCQSQGGHPPAPVTAHQKSFESTRRGDGTEQTGSLSSMYKHCHWFSGQGVVGLNGESENMLKTKLVSTKE